MNLSSSRLRVLDLTDDLALGVARQFVGTGADVVRVEPSTRPEPGAAARTHWHLGTRLLRTDDVAGAVTRLLPGADVVIESGPLAELVTPAMRESDPGAWARPVHVLVTPFGLDGPHAGWRADDTVASAAGGMAWLGGAPEDPPTPAPRQQATQLAGTHAVVAAQLGLLARAATGEGQLADVSAQEAVVATLETGAIAWIHAGTVPGRTGGVYGHVAHRVFATRDGHVAGGWSGPDRMWTDLLAWMVEEGEAGDLTDPAYADGAYRWAHRADVDAVVATFVASRTTDEVAEQGRLRSLPWAAVARPDDLLTHPQLHSRDHPVAVALDDGTVVHDVGFGHRSPGLPGRLRAAEKVGPGVAWLPRDGDGVRPTFTSRGRTPGSRSGALAGLRVLDLTWVLAGPYVTKTLAEHGAEVVKVESRFRQDPTRFSPSMHLRPGHDPNDSGYFLNFNRNKSSVALNLRHEDGPAVLRRLAAEADVVVENYAPGVLAKWGLDWPHLRTIRPDAVLVSMAGVGSTGPWRSAVTFADTLAAMSGLTWETRAGDGPPQGLTFGLGDMVAANAALVGTLDLLARGTGGHLDLSQLEAMAAHLGPSALEPALGGQAAEADQACLVRTAGPDRWLAIGATPAPVRARALARLGIPGDPAGFAAHASTCDADELAAALQQAGLPAHPVRDGSDLVERDPQLLARRWFTAQQHPLAGEVLVDGLVQRLHGTPGGLNTPAPLLGEHTDDVLSRWLDLPAHEITDLRTRGALQ